MIAAMIAALALWLSADPVADPRLDLLPPQDLPPGQCALALWDITSRTRIAMVSNAGLTLVLDGATLLLAPDASPDTNAIAPEAGYSNGQVSARHQLNLEPGASRNGTVTEGVLAVRRADGAALVIPVTGLVGCG